MYKLHFDNFLINEHDDGIGVLVFGSANRVSYLTSKVSEGAQLGGVGFEDKK